MLKNLDEVRNAALRLPVPERAALAEELLESVSPRPGVREEDLRVVLAARVAALESGEEDVLDGPSAVAEISRDLRRRTKAS